jgi:hypothetical protein
MNTQIITNAIQVIGQLSSQVLRQKLESRIFEEGKETKISDLDPSMGIELPDIESMFSSTPSIKATIVENRPVPAAPEILQLPAATDDRETNKSTATPTGCIPCALGHVGTANNAIQESIRFARKGGLADPEAILRYNTALDELNGMERLDMTPDMLINLPPWEKKIAEQTLDFSRDTRHKIERLRSFDELEKLAAEMRKHRLELGNTWYTQKLSAVATASPEESLVENSIDHDESTC